MNCCGGVGAWHKEELITFERGSESEKWQFPFNWEQSQHVVFTDWLTTHHKTWCCGANPNHPAQDAHLKDDWAVQFCQSEAFFYFRLIESKVNMLFSQIDSQHITKIWCENEQREDQLFILDRWLTHYLTMSHALSTLWVHEQHFDGGKQVRSSDLLSDEETV